MKAIIKALGLPTTYKVIQSAKGNMLDRRYVELATLHSGTLGHSSALARYLDGEWKEITADEYNNTVREIFRL
jgi:hypothetical protein